MRRWGGWIEVWPDLLQSHYHRPVCVPKTDAVRYFNPTTYLPSAGPVKSAISPNITAQILPAPLPSTRGKTEHLMPPLSIRSSTKSSLFIGRTIVKFSLSTYVSLTSTSVLSASLASYSLQHLTAPRKSSLFSSALLLPASSSILIRIKRECASTLSSLQRTTKTFESIVQW